MATAGEGGAWGIAVLADYLVSRNGDEKLEEFLDRRIFAGQEGTTMEPDPADTEGYEKFMMNYSPLIALIAVTAVTINLVVSLRLSRKKINITRVQMHAEEGELGTSELKAVSGGKKC